MARLFSKNGGGMRLGESKMFPVLVSTGKMEVCGFGIGVRRDSVVLGRRRGRRFPPTRATRRLLGRLVIHLFNYRHDHGTRVRHGGDGVAFMISRGPAHRRRGRVRARVGHLVRLSVPIACRFISHSRVPTRIGLSHLPSSTDRALHLIHVNSCSIYPYVNGRIHSATRVNGFMLLNAG